MKLAIALCLLTAACSGAGAIINEEAAPVDSSTPRTVSPSEQPMGEQPQPITPSGIDAGVDSSTVDAGLDTGTDAPVEADAAVPPPPPPVVARHGVTFDGTANQRMMANFPADLMGKSTFTFEGWFSHAVANNGLLFATGQAYCAIVTSGVGVGKVACCPDKSGIGCGYSAAVMPTNKFFHLAVVVSDSTLSMYVDGALQTTVAAPATYTSENQFTSNLMFGMASSAFSAKVIVDEFRLSYTKRYDADFVPSVHLDADAETKSAWLLDEGVGPTSGSLTLYGGASWVTVAR